MENPKVICHCAMANVDVYEGEKPCEICDLWTEQPTPTTGQAEGEWRVKPHFTDEGKRAGWSLVDPRGNECAWQVWNTENLEALASHLNAQEQQIATIQRQLAEANRLHEADHLDMVEAVKAKVAEYNRAEAAETALAAANVRNEQLVRDGQEWLTIGRENDELHAELAALRPRAVLADWLLDQVTVATHYLGTENEYQSLVEPQHGESLSDTEIVDILYEFLSRALTLPPQTPTQEAQA